MTSSRRAQWASPRAVLAVERVQPGDEAAAGSAWSALRDRPDEDRVADGSSQTCGSFRDAVEAGRVEQGDARALASRRAARSSCGWKPWPISRTTPAALHGRHVVGRELEVVRLGSGRGQVRDVDPGPPSCSAA